MEIAAVFWQPVNPIQITAFSVCGCNAYSINLPREAVGAISRCARQHDVTGPWS